MRWATVMWLVTAMGMFLVVAGLATLGWDAEFGLVSALRSGMVLCLRAGVLLVAMFAGLMVRAILRKDWR